MPGTARRTRMNMSPSGHNQLTLVSSWMSPSASAPRKVMGRLVSRPTIAAP